jgi:hypothetical protein
VRFEALIIVVEVYHHLEENQLTYARLHSVIAEDNTREVPIYIEVV